MIHVITLITFTKVKVKVKLSHYRTGQALWSYQKF